MSLSAHLALLEVTVRDVIGFLLVLQIQIVLEHLLFYRDAVFKDHCVFDSAQLFLDLYSMKANRILLVAVRKRDLSVLVLEC